MSQICSICKDELFVSSKTINSTQCGHMFHDLCIIKWIESSTMCPSCRQMTVKDNLIKLHPHYNNDCQSESYQNLVQSVQELKLMMNNQKEQTVSNQEAMVMDDSDEETLVDESNWSLIFRNEGLAADSFDEFFLPLNRPNRDKLLSDFLREIEHDEEKEIIFNPEEFDDFYLDLVEEDSDNDEDIGNFEECTYYRNHPVDLDDF